MEIKVGKRPEYMEKLTRKQCNAIIKTRASMLPVKNNFKKGSKTDNQCRFCKMVKETQEHIIQECPKMTSRRGMSITYNDIFRDDVEKLREAANVIIAIEETVRKAPHSRPACAPPLKEWATRLIRANAKQQQQQHKATDLIDRAVVTPYTAL